MAKYGSAVGKSVKSAMHREKSGTLKSGKGGKGGTVKSKKQAIAIGLSKARRAGVKLPAPKEGKVSAKMRAQAQREFAKGQSGGNAKPSPRRSRAAEGALKKEGRTAASHEALARQARSSSRARGPAARRAAALKAVRTKGHSEIQRAARKAARTRSKR